MRPTRRSFGEGAATMLIETTNGTGMEFSITFVLAGLERLRRKEWDLFVQNRAISSNTDILGSDIGKPEQVVRDATPDASISWWVPPVQDISFLKLMAGSLQNVLACHLGPRIK